jgi:Ca2+-binding RTX toxin-like protein
MYFVDNAGDQVSEAAGEGIDKLYTKVDYTKAPGKENEFLYADAGTTGLALTGNELRNTLKGGPGDDALKGGAGGDKLYGGAGDDRLEGGSWSDTMAGGTGNDVYFVDNIGDRVIEAAGEGADKVYTRVDYALDAGQAIELLRADAGTTGLTLTGNELRNTLEGGEGDDRLYGKGGGDKLRGGAGDDFLDGGRWSDTLTGGTGADTFAFASAFAGGSNVDTVADFAPGIDVIQLDRTWFAGLSLGQLAAAQFATGAATASGPQIVYDTTTGALFFDSNGSASGGRAQFAQLSPGLALTANDFSVV